MSSYRSSYIPWQASLPSSNSYNTHTSKQNATSTTDRYGSDANKRYSSRGSSFGAPSSSASSSSTTATTTTSTSSTNSPSYLSYRKSTPSILKKYANYASNNASAAAIAVAGALANANASRKTANNARPVQETKEDDSSAKIVSNIPRCTAFSNTTKLSPTRGENVWSGQNQTIGRSAVRRRNEEIEQRSPSPAKTLFVTRATSPTPARAGRRTNDGDNVLLSEMCKPKYYSLKSYADSASQTEEPSDSQKAPAPPSRTVASLSNKFLSAANSPGSSGRFSPKGAGGYAYARPTDLPIRSSSLLRPSYHSPSDRISPNADRLSPSFFQSYNSSLSSPPPAPPLPTSWARTPSPLTVLHKSLTSLTLEEADAEKHPNNDDSDTEDESSYEENHPMKGENERYGYANVTAIDKPPKYPPSPNALCRSKSIVGAENRTGISIRSLSTSSNSSGAGGAGCRVDSSCEEDIADKQHIPVLNSGFNDTNNNNIIRASSSDSSPKPYAIRRIDSGEAPWWLGNNSKSPETSDTSQQCGYRIRKMDSADSPWWCKTSSTAGSETPSESFNQQRQRTNASGNSSSDNARPTSSNLGYTLRKMDSSDAPWWCNSEEERPSEDAKAIPAADQVCSSDETKPSFHQIRRFDSGEKDWWAESDSPAPAKSSTPSIPDWWNNVKSDDECDGCVETYKSNKVLRIKKIESVDKSETSENESRRQSWLNDRENGQNDVNEGERTDVNSFCEDTSKLKYINELDNLLLYIGDHTNIDELLGTEVPPPAAPVTPTGDDSSTEDELDEGCEKISAQQVKIHDGSAYTSTIHRRNGQLDDAALQLYKDGDYCSYLDLDSSISEQQEEFEGFQPSRKDSIVMRTQLSVRVHLIIEKLMKSEGRELRRALFSLKQIFQEDKDLVHEFVQNDGLDCLIKVGSDVDQNYQNYILRALGQVMLYVDGMNGVMEHNPTIQWLYSLVSSKFRLVVKTALKLLLVFVEYVESNCLLLIQAIHALNLSQGTLPWSNIMRLLHEYDATDTELLIYAMTLVNKTLNGIADQDTYYDQVDLLEEQDIESVIRKYMSKQGTDLDLLRQFQIYEAVLQHEDGEDKSTPLKQLDETIRKTLRNRKSLTNGSMNGVGGCDERRKSRRHSTGMTTTYPTPPPLTNLIRQYSETSSPDDHRIKSTTDGVGVTPGLRRRRERAERQRSLLREQYESNMRTMMDTTSSSEDGIQNGNANYCIPQVYVNNTVNKLKSMEDTSLTNVMRNNYQNGEVSPTLKREATVKDITQKLATLQTPAADDNTKSQNIGRVEEMKGIISKAMEGLAKSQSRCDILRSPTNECVRAEIKKSETDLHWEELLATSTRALHLCDLDFSDLMSDDEHDVLAPSCSANGAPPPPPPCCVPPPVPSVPNCVSNKAKKTVKLFWKEVREDPIVMAKLNSKQLIWDEMFPVSVDTQRLEHLFESRAKDLISKEKQHEMNKSKEIIVLDPKRSNAINIGMTKLPPPRSIKTAILKMDSTVMNREGIEKLLTMLPTEEERSKIQEAQSANPDLPLGTAEHFLLTLASISELTARLKLWSFKLNYENIEKEIADPLMDLKQGMEVLRANKTFRAILSTLLSIGIFLNGAEVKGFQVEYLSKVPEVKDTVHKHSLLHHLCHIVMEKFPESTDLYSEIGAITRASRVDFDELSHSIEKVKHECKASFDHLKAIAKHDGNTAVKLKLSEFLADCAERIIALGKIHRRLLNRFYKFCLWLGIPLHRIQTTKPNELCKIISEFALEYRTTRERVIQQLEKKASHRERNKTRGKMITEVKHNVGKFRSKEDRQDAELRQLLGKEHSPEYDNNTNNLHCGSLPWRRLRKDNAKNIRDEKLNGHLTDADDELLETLVKTATKTPASRNTTRERKRTRHSERKSLIPKRSRTRDNILIPGNISASP
ncbi:FH1/FH2 domain-containing protein 3-like isoform X3 [Planococcus citri]|uniref:FH1/FH2 domain-containing protein 3-like isoform X3 n=1 Tax=Planococcus citri TaxID=170843 RepID=UPI0031F7FDBF